MRLSRLLLEMFAGPGARRIADLKHLFCGKKTGQRL